MTSDNPERLVPDMRNVRYGEVLGVFARDGRFEAEVFGTQLINDCPQELWETLDATEIAADMGAIGVKLNGPRYWTLDAFGQKVAVACLYISMPPKSAFWNEDSPTFSTWLIIQCRGPFNIATAAPY